jgi:outer membrane protein assembly factor BamB
MALDAQLCERWSQVLGGETTVEAVAVAARADGGAVAAGHGPARSGGPDLLYAAALADDGRIVWNRAVGEGRGPWRARHVVVARAVPDNRAGCAVLVAGDSSRSPSAAQRGALVAALDADSGTPLWELELRGGETIAYGLAATRDGGALAAGSTATAGGRSEACLWRLAEDGSVDWTRRLTADNDS